MKPPGNRFSPCFLLPGSAALALQFIVTCCLAAEQRPEWQPHQDRYCGPNTLYIACKLLNVDASLAELGELCATSELGTSLANIQTAAEAKGLFAVPMTMRITSLRNIASPAIAHMKVDHYVLIVGHTAKGFLVVDPPNEPTFISDGDFDREWSGVALLLDNKPIRDSSAMLRRLGFALCAVPVLAVAVFAIRIWGKKSVAASGSAE